MNMQSANPDPLQYFKSENDIRKDWMIVVQERLSRLGNESEQRKFLERCGFGTDKTHALVNGKSSELGSRDFLRLCALWGLNIEDHLKFRTDAEADLKKDEPIWRKQIDEIPVKGWGSGQYGNEEPDLSNVRSHIWLRALHRL